MKLKRLLIAAAGTIAFFAAGSAGQSFAASHHYVSHPGIRVASAGVSVTIGTPFPPAIRYSYPPELVVVPGTNVYFVPSNGIDVLFYQGFWWRPYRGYWYRSRAYNGPWYHIQRNRVPRSLYRLPKGYRHSYTNHPRLHYREVQRNWHRWDKERYQQRHRSIPTRHYNNRQENRKYYRDHRRRERR